MRARLLRTLLLLVLACGVPAKQLRAAPFTLVTEDVASYSIAAPRLLWHTASGCLEGPDGAPLGAGSEDIRRVAAFGGEPRVLFSKGQPRVPGSCIDQPVLSEIVADPTDVYWLEEAGVARLATVGNEPPEIINTGVRASDTQWRVELAQNADSLFAILPSQRAGTRIWQISKENGAETLLATVNGRTRDLQARGRFLYWIQNDDLKRFDLLTRGTPATLVTDVTSYFPEGRRLAVLLGNGGGAVRVAPPFTDYVFVGRGASIVRYDNEKETLSAPLYQSTDSDARVFALAANDDRLFFFERRMTGPVGGLFDDLDQLLFRTSRGGGPVDLLHQHRSLAAGATDIENLLVSRVSTQAAYVELTGEFVFWQQAGTVQRLSTNAAAFEETDLTITDIEVTQAIQDLDNSVFLVAGKKTFVRVHTKSFGASIPGVPARLWRLDSSGEPVGNALYPVNESGGYLTVPAEPDRRVVDDSFLFQLPWDWVASGDLRLRAELNPWRLPAEPSYRNNSREVGPLELRPSSRLDVHFIAFEYEDASSPRYKEDILQTHSWIRRTYPISSAPANLGDNSKGLATSTAYVFDDDLDEAMENAYATAYFVPIHHVLARLAELQAFYGSDRLFFGLFRAIEGVGKAGGSIGCASTGTSKSEETDKPFTGKVAAHEIGHMLGRDHPRLTGNCYNTSGADQAFPYDGGFIGPPDGSITGFGGGEAFFDVPRGVYPSDTWHDFMTYCYTQWVSDYTYEHLYSGLAAEDAGGGAAADLGGGAGAPHGWLGVFGEIHPREGFASIRRITQSDSVRLHPPRVGRAYKLQLLDAEQSLLSEHAFDGNPLSDDHTGTLQFAQVVPFVATAEELRIVQAENGRKLVSFPIAAEAPRLTDVRVNGAGNPKATKVTLRWSAEDPGGEELAFDVFYSRDSGETFHPLHFGLRQNLLKVDKSRVGGGSVFFRVIASSGSRMTSADTKAIDLPVEAPSPRILAPADGTRVRWGQLVSFEGDADDVQDGRVPHEALSWSLNGQPLGNGPLLAVDDLPVGSNKVLLTATNSLGSSASTSITIVVNDVVEIPGPILHVGPGAVSWSVPAEGTRLHIARLKIANAGAGPLAWTAMSSQGWLNLSARDGSAPETLTLSVDPSSLPVDAIHAAEVTIAADEQTVTVPVRLVIGDPREDGDQVVRFRRGDANGDGSIDISDAGATLNWLFLGKDELPCVEAADTNGTEGTDIADASYLLNFLFLGGDAPAAPFPLCGGAPGEEVDCERFNGCP